VQGFFRHQSRLSCSVHTRLLSVWIHTNVA
jgi:hypothetical protein